MPRIPLRWRFSPVGADRVPVYRSRGFDASCPTPVRGCDGRGSVGEKTPQSLGHVKASLTAAIVVRSLWAALGVVWVTGVLVGWVVDRGDWFGLVVGSVVVAVDMRDSCVGNGSKNAKKLQVLREREWPPAGMLTTPRTRGILRHRDLPPRTATASTLHLRVEQSSADGNLTDHI